ncbi:MAG: thioredoxin family protein [Flavobacteriaceae bacterium]
MKKIFLGLLFISTLSAFSQEAAVWLTDFDEAAKISKKTKKPILANFTGSDWCGYCKVLTRKVFSTLEFKEWAEDNVVLLELDFPKRKKLAPKLAKQNKALQRAFGVRGYPTIWLFKIGKGKDPKKNMIQLGKTGYVKGGFEKWVATVDKILK